MKILLNMFLKATIIIAICSINARAQSLLMLNDGYKIYNKSLEYKIFETGQGAYIKDSDMVLVNLIQMVGDTEINNSLKRTKEPFLTAFYKGNSNSIGPLFFQLRAGDSIVLRRNVDSFYSERKKPAYYKPGDEVLELYKVVKIIAKPQRDSLTKAIEQSVEDAKNRIADERQRDPEHRKALAKRDRVMMLEYCGLNDIMPEITSSGLFYAITKPGIGPEIKKGNKVKLNYTCYLLDGRIFDSNIDDTYGKVKPLEFVVGKAKLLEGFAEGIMYANKGCKMTIIIPSLMAFGEFPPKNSIAEPNSILRYDIEILDVKKTK
jgi:FKBP-type peptidyl-prolyl cis-trans isomerase FkpA